MDLCVNDEILELFRLIKERNILARARFNKRQRKHYLSKLIDKKLTNRLTGKHLKTPITELNKALKKATIEYIAAVKELSAFTKKNRSTRSDLQKKYKTKQANSASNTVEGVSLEFFGSRLVFRVEQINKILLENELNDILLGLPQI